MGKSTINGNFPWLFVCLPQGKYSVNLWIVSQQLYHSSGIQTKNIRSTQARTRIEHTELTQLVHGGTA